MEDVATISNLLSAGNMLGGLILLGFSWMLKIIFGRMREFFDRSEAEDEKIEAKMLLQDIETRRVETLRREVDRELFKEILQVKVELAGLIGEKTGFAKGLVEAREQARIIRECQKP